MNNEFYNHERSDRIKWIIAAIAILLVAVMVIGLCLQLFGKGKAKPSEWFDKTEQTTPDNQPDNEQSGSIIGDSESNGIRLMSVEIPQSAYGDYGISPMSVETAYTITATFEPENTTETELNWTLEWGSETGSWGNESKGTVTDYIGLSANELTATVTLKKAFGTQVILKVTSKKYPDVNASVTIDYVARMGALPNISYSDKDAITLNINEDEATMNTSYQLKLNTNPWIGTKMGQYTVKSAVFKPAVEYSNFNYAEFQKANEAYKSMGSSIARKETINLNVTTRNEFSGYFQFKYKDFFTFNGSSSITTQIASYLKAAIVKTANNGAPAYGKITFTVEYAYEDYYSNTTTCVVDVVDYNASALSVAPSSVNLSQSGLLF